MSSLNYPLSKEIKEIHLDRLLLGRKPGELLELQGRLDSLDSDDYKSKVANQLPNLLEGPAVTRAVQTFKMAPVFYMSGRNIIVGPFSFLGLYFFLFSPTNQSCIRLLKEYDLGQSTVPGYKPPSIFQCK